MKFYSQRANDDPVLVEIGKKYNKTGAHIALAWGIAQGHTVLPKSKTPSRIKSNLEGDFKLDEEDLAKIAKIDKKARFNDSSESFGYKFFTDCKHAPPTLFPFVSQEISPKSLLEIRWYHACSGRKAAIDAFMYFIWDRQRGSVF